MECPICGMEFTEKKRLERHVKTHLNKKPKKQKKAPPDFDGPRFDQVM